MLTRPRAGRKRARTGHAMPNVRSPTRIRHPARRARCRETCEGIAPRRTVRGTAVRPFREAPRSVCGLILWRGGAAAVDFGDDVFGGGFPGGGFGVDVPMG